MTGYPYGYSMSSGTGPETSAPDGEVRRFGRRDVGVSVSVVIPAKNESAMLPQCIRAIEESVGAAKELIRSFEIVVVDNGSSDSTQDVARALGCQVFALSGLVGACRNKGASLAAGEVLTFVDADVVVPREFFEKLLPRVADPRVGVVGAQYGIGRAPGWVELACQAQRAPGRNLPGGCMLLRRNVFESVGGFDEGMRSGEDSDLCARITERGWLVCSESAMHVVHLGNAKSLRDVFRREIWHGAGLWERGGLFRWSPTKIAVLAFAFAHILGLTITVLALCRGDLFLLAWGAAVWLGAPLGIAATFAALKVLDVKQYLALLPIYYVYMIARCVAILWRPGRLR